jgi:hypothetical protein
VEREAGRNLEVMWLTGRLAPDHKTIADFRKDNGPAIRKVCARFVELCRKMGLLTKASVAIDGSKFKAVNSRDNNFTQGKIHEVQTGNGSNPKPLNGPVRDQSLSTELLPDCFRVFPYCLVGEADENRNSND